MYNYYTWFFLQPEDGNMQFAHPNPALRVAPLLEVHSKEVLQNLTVDDNHFAFAEKSLPYVHWLKQFLQYRKVYIFDNHNHALAFRYREYLHSHKVCHLLHIDQHSDRKENPHQLPIDLLEKDRSAEVFHFVQRYTNVGNFMQPALQAKLISGISPILSEYALKRIDIPLQPYILDIDVDFRAPEMGNQLSLFLPKLKQLIKKAECITIATSPYFLKQEKAIELVKSLANIL